MIMIMITLNSVAVACWLLSIILFAIVVEFGSALMIITGFFLAIVNLLFLTNYSQSTILNIPFASPIAGKTVFLKTSYSWCFYVNLINCKFFQKRQNNNYKD